MKRPLGHPVYNPDGPLTTHGKFVALIVGLAIAAAIVGWLTA